jgi:uncharacterized phage protein gp47/JayE
MSFSRPTLRTLVDRVIADINARLPGADARLPYSNLNVLAHVHGAAAHGMYGYLDWIARQVIIDTCEAEYLDRWAAIWGVLRKAATPATGNVTFTGVNGSSIPVGTLLARADGVQYKTTALVSIASGTATTSAVEVAGGVTGNYAASGQLSLVVPVAGVDATATVAAGGLTGGADTETDDALRSRLLQRIQNPPQGGAAADYVAWALEVAGVTRAWCYPLEDGAGTVKVRFMMDNNYDNGIPQAGDVTAVQNYIDALRPVAIAVGGFTTVAPVAAPINFTMTVSPNTQTVRDAVTAELKDMILRDSAPGGVIRISRIREAISLAAGETDYTLTAPSADITHTANQIATMGTITFS